MRGDFATKSNGLRILKEPLIRTSTAAYSRHRFPTGEPRFDQPLFTSVSSGNLWLQKSAVRLKQFALGWRFPLRFFFNLNKQSSELAFFQSFYVCRIIGPNL